MTELSTFQVRDRPFVSHCNSTIVWCVFPVKRQLFPVAVSHCNSMIVGVCVPGPIYKYIGAGPLKVPQRALSFPITEAGRKDGEGDTMLTAPSNSPSGTFATRTAVTCWRFDSPACSATWRWETKVGAPPLCFAFSGRPSNCFSNSPQRRIASTNSGAPWSTTLRAWRKVSSFPKPAFDAASDVLTPKFWDLLGRPGPVYVRSASVIATRSEGVKSLRISFSMYSPQRRMALDRGMSHVTPLARATCFRAPRRRLYRHD